MTAIRSSLRPSVWIGAMRLALAAAAAGLLAASLLSKEVMTLLFNRTSYFFLIALCVFFVRALRRTAVESGFAVLPALRRSAPGALLCLLVTSFVFWTCPPYLRTLGDEADLVAVSKSMAQRAVVSPEVFGDPGDARVFGVDGVVTKRPLFFPFLVHLLHLASGYRVSNAFAVNFLLHSTLLYFIFGALRNRFGFMAAAGGVFLAASQPVLTFAATSAQFDLCAIVVLAAVLLLLRAFLVNPSAAKLEALTASALIYAHIRYEGSLLLIMLAGGLALGGRIRKFHLHGSSLYAAAPLMMLPIVWQRVLTASYLFDNVGEGKTFSWTYFADHVPAFVSGLLGREGLLPYAPVVNWAGLAGIFYAAYLAMRGSLKAAPRTRLFWLIGGVWLALVSTAALAYHYHPFDPAAARLTLPVAAVLSISAAAFGGAWVKTPFQKAVWVVGCAGTFLLYHAQAVDNRFMTALEFPLERIRVTSFLRSLPEPPSGLIDEHPEWYAIDGINSVNFGFARALPERILERAKKGGGVYVVRQIHPDSGKPLGGTDLENRFELIPVFSFPGRRGARTQILKVAGGPSFDSQRRTDSHQPDVSTTPSE